jgi:hypothetical protein
MSTLTISSPGVQINEVDLSVRTATTGATTVFVTGFANQGPTNELINVSSISEFENIFGTPTNAVERYFYQTSRQILNASPANLLVTRMPYGSGNGAGFSNQYTALVYPLSSNASTYSASSAFTVLPPKSILLTDDQYNTLLAGNVTWGTGYTSNTIQNFSDLTNYGGIVVLDSVKTSVDDLYQGYYIGFADNSNVNPATDFNAITSVQAANAVTGTYQTFTTVPSSRLNFSLTQSFSAAGTSLSQIIENYPVRYNFGSSSYNDCLTLMLFKIRSSTYAQDTVTLDYVVSEGYTGSLNANRTQNNVNGGPAITFNLDNIANTGSTNITVITNPNISRTGTWTNSDGTPAKTVRVDNSAKNLYSKGVFIANTNVNADDVGNVPQKLQRILQNIDNLDVNLDVSVEAGLGTIWASAKARWSDANYGNSSATAPYIFDENYYLSLTGLKNQSTGSSDSVATNYQAIASQFVSFASNTRKDHIFIADPVRNIFVQGVNTKNSTLPNFVFSTDIYWSLLNLYGSSISSYATTYGNWLLVNDSASNSQVWIPSSGFAAAIFATVSQTNYPWTAPAGFNRATLTNVLDLAINPSQKQRDLLYKINVNPIAYFPGDGYVLYGQKTLFTKPSAFDRINVRRLFLTLEKATKKLLKYYVFEPNTFTTRTRLVNALAPIFDQAKNSDGLYDYRIICDTSNNTPAVIDNNQLNVAIYIQPVRTAEFILCDFIATTTGVNLNELTS